jgi:hypothetical protein
MLISSKLRRVVLPQITLGLRRGYKGISAGNVNWTHECSSLADPDLETARLEK